NNAHIKSPRNPKRGDTPTTTLSNQQNHAFQSPEACFPTAALHIRVPGLKSAAIDYLQSCDNDAHRRRLEEFLGTIVEAEAPSRAKSALVTRRKNAGLPTGVSFNAWDPARSTIPVERQEHLKALDWVDRHDNLVLCGPQGTGKSMLTEALAVELIKRGKKVKWLTMKNLGQLINRHAADLDPHKGFAKLAKLDLVILDDVGYFDVTVAEANGFLALIEATYQHTSLAITSNSHPSRFADLMPQVRPTQINAAIDRLGLPANRGHLVELPSG
ncbi:ATP-binding protein, partial [Corynebacterium phoceense]|uniref:ATP-binding protein n=1 Tax=Corynebacterium phoceense TaxID=1686286 RepID=UPI00211BA1C3